MRRLKILTRIVVILIAIQVAARIAGQILRRCYLGKEVDEDSVNAVAVMGGSEDRVTSKSFKGGYLTAIMGGIQLDLTDAAMEQKPATIEANIIMGGAAIKVPHEWKVNLDVTQTMAGVKEKGRQSDLSKETPDLLVTGKIVMGGLEIIP